jgi:hypothetical protein
MSLVLITPILTNAVLATTVSSGVTSDQMLSQDSIFAKAAKDSQYNTYKNTLYNFSFTPPTGWTQETSDNQLAFFTKDAGGTIASLGIDYVKGSPLPDSIFSLPEQTVLDAVANNVLNSSQPIVGKSMEKFSDGFKFRAIYASQASQQIVIKSEQILFWLKDGRQFYFTMICDDYNFNKNSADFENATNTFYVTKSNQPVTQLDQQINVQTKIPVWIKKNAGWWADGTIGDDDFVKGVQYMIQSGLMKIPQDNSASSSSHQIPVWIKKNAGWWADGTIGDDDFVKGVQYLVASGIIKV